MNKAFLLPSAILTVLCLAATYVIASMGVWAVMQWFQPPIFAANVCNNNGSLDAGETCSNCPYDVRCSSAQKCIAGACTSTNWSCKREDICGDGWVTAFEVCDDGGLCTGSTTAMYDNKDCFTLDPLGNPHAGVARCRARGGICVAQNNDGCEADCQTACFPNGYSCLSNTDCCGGTCTSGMCM